MTDWVILEGDCVDRMREMDEASIDAIVTDPPYGLHFMGKNWDQFGGPTGKDNTTHTERGGAMHAGKYDFTRNQEFQREMTSWAVECLRILKPGGHLLAFGGTRTYHRLACAIEDAGFEIRDSLIWLYGSGFPKSLDVSKAIDKAAGAERTEVTGRRMVPDAKASRPHFAAISSDDQQTPEHIEYERTAPATPEAQKWNGWGTALKPGHEPIVVARKPLSGTVAQNVTEYGTGALNIDGCRIGTDAIQQHGRSAKDGDGWGEHWHNDLEAGKEWIGRWPANVALSHLPDCSAARCPICGSDDPMKQNRYGELWSNGSRYVVCPDPWHKGGCAPGCPIAQLDEQSGERPSAGSYRDPVARTAVMDATGPANTPFTPGGQHPNQYANETGGASRFFYQAKASRGERNAGLDGFESQLVQSGMAGDMPTDDQGKDRDRFKTVARNVHPTVKPIDLMRWLVRLVTPPGGTVLDPFTGSGTTGIAAVLEGFDFIGIEREAEYVEIARARLAFWEPHGGRDTEDVLVEAGFSERLQEEYRAAGQMGLLDG